MKADCTIRRSTGILPAGQAGVSPADYNFQTPGKMPGVPIGWKPVLL
jgi:hypothetical protein